MIAAVVDRDIHISVVGHSHSHRFCLVIVSSHFSCEGMTRP